MTFTIPGLPFDVLQLAAGIFGGLSLFLYGLGKIGTTLKYLYGHRLRSLMLTMTQNRFTALLSGAWMTLMLQSSGAMTVLLVGFVSARMISLRSALAVVLGAGIGTAATIQLVSLNLSELALVPIAIGFLMQIIISDERGKQVGHGLLGLGLMFFGIHILGHGLAPLEGWGPFTLLMGKMSSPWWGIMMAAAFTGVVQSATATLAVVISLCSHGLIASDAALMAVLGANIGSSFLTLIIASGKNREALRTALANLLFRVITAGIVLYFTPSFMWAVTSLSGTALAREVANAHLLFNLGMALLFLPFIGGIAKLLAWLIPTQQEAGPHVKAKFLDEMLLNTPSLAFDATRQELIRVGERVCQMMESLLPVITQGSRAQLHVLKHQDDAVDDLHAQVVNYLAKASQLKLSEAEQQELMGLIHIANALENIGDLIETNLVALGKKRIRLGFEVAPQDLAALNALHREVTNTLAQGIMASLNQDEALAQQVMSAKTNIRKLVDFASRQEAQRLAQVGQEGIDRYTFEHDIIDKLQRIYYHARKMAQNTLTPASNHNLNPAD